MLGVLNGATYRLSLSLVDGSIVLPWFVSQVTDSRVVIGLLVAIQTGGWFLPQLFLSTYMQRQPRRLPAYNVACAGRWLFWLLVALSPFVLGARRPEAMLATVLVGYAGYYLLGGVSGLAFMDLVAQGIHARQRGTFFAWRNLTGGVLAVAGSLLVSWAMAPGTSLAFPSNFGLLAMANLAVTAVMFASFSFWTELPFPLPPPRAAGLSRAVLAILRRDGNLRRFLLTRVLFIGAGVTTPFFVIRATELGGPQRYAGLFLLVYTLSELAANLVWGWVSDHVSSKAALGLTGAVALAPNLLAAVFRPDWPGALYLLAFALLGAVQSGWMVTGMTLVLEIADPHDRPIYVGLANTIMGIPTLLLPLGGLLAEAKGLPFLFLLAMGLAGVGLLSLPAWQDPRKPGYVRPVQREMADLREW